MLTNPSERNSTPARPGRVQRIRRAAKVTTGLGVATLLAVPVLVTSLGDDGPGEEIDASPVAATDTVPPSTTAAPTTTTTVPEPTPEEEWQAWYASLSDEDRLRFELFSMDDAERAEWAAFVSPPPPPPEPAPEPEPAPAPAPAPEPVPNPPAVPAVDPNSVWDQLAQCEASGNWHINTGNGYSGGLQFHPTTWTSLGGGEFAPYAYLATREQQIVIGERVLAAQGWGAWPGCTRKMGLR